MFEQLRYKIGLSFSQLRFRSVPEQAIRWTGAVSSARRALLLLPESSHDAAAVRKVVEYFVKRFSPGNVVVVGRVDATTLLAFDRHIHLLTFTPSDINTWFLPRGELTRKVKKSTFDVAVDLNLEVALPNAYLCRASDARIRVGFKGPYADTFYNFQVQSRHNNFEAAYTSLMECLQMF